MKMKQLLVFLLSLVLFFGLFLLYDNLAYNKAMIDSGLSYESKKVEISSSFQAVIKGVGGETIVVQPIESMPVLNNKRGFYEYIVESFNEYEIVLIDTEVDCELEVGKIVNIIYKYKDGIDNVHPQGRNLPYWFYRVEKITDANINLEEIILYNGRRYNKNELSEETLNWLELSDEEKEKSDYYPQDLVKNGYFDLLSNVEEWGLRTDSFALSRKISIDIYQEDFIPTTLNDNWIYSVDSKFEIQKFDIEKQQWFKVETLYGEEEIPWDDGIEILELDSEVPYGYGINWEWLYGELPRGEYRIKKEIKVDKAEDDYSWRTVYWYFEIKEFY